MRFPNGTTVETPEGRGVVVNADRPDERDVRFSDKVAGFRVKTFRIEQLQAAPKLNDKDLTKRATKDINSGIRETTKAFGRGSEQKTMRKDKSGETTLQNTNESEKKP